MSHPFGDLLGQYLHRKHGLSQFKLADGIDQPPSVISEMCQGKRLTGPQARDRVVSILLWLYKQGALITKEEADALLESAGLAPLQERITTEAEFLRQLSPLSLSNRLQHKEKTTTEHPKSRLNWERSATAPRDNLPLPPTPLIGRETEIGEIIKILNQTSCHLLTLTGQGGIGKTRLAIEAASRVTHNFPDGIIFTTLQPATEPAFLALAIIDAIGVPLYVTNNPRTGLINFLRERKMLLLLDNFEELLQSSVENTASTIELLAEIIKQSPGVKLLVTSRVVLNLSGEWVYPVLSLTYPLSSLSEPGIVIPPMEDLTPFSAISLFIERARRVRHNFSAADEMAGIIQICQVVEGLPLALEMAAAWTKSMNCATIASEIRGNLNFLETSLRDVPVRHRSILAVINQSWQTLSPEERQVYARLSVFKGGFQRQAAEQVAGAILSILSALVDQSLLRWEPDDRYQIHELLRQFAADHLEADPETARITNDLHCMFYADFLDQCSAGITGRQQQEVLHNLTAELQNVRAAWRRAVDEYNLPALYKATYTYYEFCDFTSRYLEGTEAFELAISRLLERKAPDPQAAEVLALLYPLLGYHYIRLGKFEPSQMAFKAGQEILRTNQLELKPGFGTDPMTGLGLLALVKGDYSTSIQFAETGREASLLRDDPLNLQIACYVLANATFSLGDYIPALSYVDQGLISTEVTGNQWMKAQLLTVQGHIAQAQNQYSLAQQKYRESYLIKQELNDPEGEATAFNSLAQIALLQKNPKEAYELYLKGLEIFQHINDPGGLGNSYSGLGDSALAQGDLPTACHYYRQGLQIAIQIKWLPLTITLLTGISELFLQTNQAHLSAVLLNKILVHPAIAEDARIRAHQSLERTLAQLSFQVNRSSISGQTEDDLFVTSQTVMAELIDLAGHYPRTGSHLENKPASNRQDMLDPLTAREIEVLQQIALGKTNQQIAATFVLSVGTIKWYSRQIYQKLGVGNRTEAVAHARKIHLLD